MIQFKQGNSVARDLPQTGSETNTTIFVIYIYDIFGVDHIWLQSDAAFVYPRLD